MLSQDLADGLARLSNLRVCMLVIAQATTCCQPALRHLLTCAMRHLTLLTQSRRVPTNAACSPDMAEHLHVAMHSTVWRITTVGHGSEAHAGVQELHLMDMLGPDGSFLATVTPTLRCLHMRLLPNFHVRDCLPSLRVLNLKILHAASAQPH